MSAQRRSLGELVRRHRLSAGFSQEELADRARLSRRGVSDIERGIITAPHQDTLSRLADALTLADAERTALQAAARGQIVPSVAPSASTWRPAESGAPPFVGRQEELALIARHLAGETAPLLLFAGEPGIGKSRLLAEATTLASAQGWRVVTGGSTRRSGQAPYEPLVSALAREVRRTPPARLRLDLQGCGWLVRLLPELLETQLVPAPSWTLAPEQERRLLFDAVAVYLANVAGAAGTLLILDDLQWADGDALALVEALVAAESGRNAPLRLLGAYRNTEVEPADPLGLLLADLVRSGTLSRRQLPLLTSAEAAALLAQLWPVQPEGQESKVEAATRAEMLRRAEGLPFYLVSSARALQESPAGATRANQGAGREGRLTAVTSGSGQVPASVAESIRARIALLPETAQQLAEVAAVTGRVISAPVVMAVSARTEEETLDALDMLVQAGLLVDDDDGNYHFTHDLIREVVEGGLGSQRRRTLHRRIAEELERRDDQARTGRSAEIGAHFLAAGEQRRALPHALLAGDQAKSIYAHAEAEQRFRMAVGLARDLDDRTYEAQALEKLGAALWEGQVRFDEAREVGDHAARLYETLHERDGELRVLADMAVRYGGTGQVDVCEARIRPRLTALEAGASVRDAPAIARVYFGLACLYAMSFRRRETLEALERGEHFARGSHDDALRLEMLVARTFAMGNLGIIYPADEAVAIIALAERLEDMQRLEIGLNLAYNCYVIKGDFAPARDCLQRLKRQGQLLQREHGWLSNIGELAFYSGDWRSAREAWEKLSALEERNAPLGAQYSSGYGSMGLGVLELAEGSEVAAMARLEPALAWALAIGDLQAIVIITGPLVEADLLAGRAEAARSHLALVNAHPGMQYPSHYSALLTPAQVWADLTLSHSDEARNKIAASEAYIRVQENCLLLPEVLRIRASMALADARWQEAETALDEACLLAHDMPLPWAELKALWVYGQLESARGKPAEARRRFEQALVICNRLGEGLYRPHIERALTVVDQSER
jgi:transcriptional regulator with XRE-family HTH domain/tetratricopeptide (TPR) repeat protein